MSGTKRNGVVTGMILAPELFTHHAGAIAALPADRPLTRADLLTPEFLLARADTRQGQVDIYYSPIHWVNTDARIALIGITPGWTQMQTAYQSARQGVRDGLPPEVIVAHAKRAASWAGQTRANLIAMLNGLGVGAALGLDDATRLFDTHWEWAHSSALVRYPVFVDGQNWTGYRPDPRSAVFAPYAQTRLAEELDALRGPCLIVLLGKSVAETIRDLHGPRLDRPDFLTIDLPHPSGANQHRAAQFAALQPRLAPLVHSWLQHHKAGL